MRYSSIICLLLGITVAFSAGCSSVKLPSGSSKGYLTYKFYEPEFEVSPERMTAQAQANKAIRSELKRAFRSNGMTEERMGADLIVSYLILIQDTVVSTAVSDYYANSGMEILRVAHEKVAIDGKYRNDFKAGTLVIDVVDTSNGELIYRNYASNRVSPDLSEMERNRRVREAVDKAIRPFFK